MSESPTENRAKLYSNQFAAEAHVWSVRRPCCTCCDTAYDDPEVTELSLHLDVQDTTCKAWHHLLELIDKTAADGSEEFSPARNMDSTEWRQIVTLPSAISKLKRVKRFIVYGSSLVRIPPEISEMSSLEQFSPYTSYRLHWFPYEITRCKNLQSSTVSTRALYGNYKRRPPFPRLPQLSPELIPERCSVCDGPFGDSPPQQAWISLRVATDVLPLLVHACSQQCLAKLPPSPEGYICGPHCGGLELKQPPGWF